jgi:hypothetical protein
VSSTAGDIMSWFSEQVPVSLFQVVAWILPCNEWQIFGSMTLPTHHAQYNNSSLLLNNAVSSWDSIISVERCCSQQVLVKTDCIWYSLYLSFKSLSFHRWKKWEVAMLSSLVAYTRLFSGSVPLVVLVESD